jgi:hypothetical protein
VRKRTLPISTWGKAPRSNSLETPNAGEAHLGSQSFHTNKLKFIERSRNAPAMKLPFLARLLTHSAAFGRYKRDHETRFRGFVLAPITRTLILDENTRRVP